MAVRVTASEVKEILDDSTLLDTIVEAFILGANAMVNTNLAGTTLSPEILKEIERWLSAHLISVTRERQAKKEGAGGASIEYTGEWGEGLKGSSYGQMAMTLDSTGTLASLDQKKATLYAIPSKRY